MFFFENVLNMRMKVFLIITVAVLAGASIPARAQVKNGYHDKLAALYEAGQYQDCAFKAERMLLKEKYKSDPEVLLYIAISYNKIYLMTKADETIITEDPEYAKAYDNALKYAIDAKKRDRKGGEFFPDNNELLEEIVYSGLPIADQYLLEKRYSKAQSLFRKFLRLVDNKHITFIKGVLDLYGLDKVAANEAFTEFFTALNSNSIPKNDNTEYLMQKGFVMYYDFLIAEDSAYLADSAKFILRQGLKLFPDDYEINQRLFPQNKAN